MTYKDADTVVVLDFETSGLSPHYGDRAIEIGAILIEKGKVKDRFQKLMNPGFRITSFIEEYTGITNNMLKNASSCTEVMREFADFIGEHNLVAHNASFDQRFLDFELNKVKRKYTGSFACSLLIARRIYQNAPNHKLRTLVEFNKISNDGVFHRALADAEMTAKLWLHMINKIKVEYEISNIPFSLMQEVASKPKAAIPSFLSRKKSLI